MNVRELNVVASTAMMNLFTFSSCIKLTPRNTIEYQKTVFIYCTQLMKKNNNFLGLNGNVASLMIRRWGDLRLAN